MLNLKMTHALGADTCTVHVSAPTWPTDGPCACNSSSHSCEDCGETFTRDVESVDVQIAESRFFRRIDQYHHDDQKMIRMSPIQAKQQQEHRLTTSQQ